MAEVYIAKQGAIVEYDGRPTVIKKGRTRVEAGHELLTRFPNLFELASDNAEFRVTTARQEPYPEGDPVKDWTVPQLTAWAGDHAVDVPKGPKGAILKAVLAGLAVLQAPPAPPADPESTGSDPETDDGGQSDDGEQEPTSDDTPSDDGDQGSTTDDTPSDDGETPADDGETPADDTTAPPAD